MSGVEVLGVVLGVLPLCISALEHYKSLEKTKDVFRRTRRAFDNDLRRLNNCQLRIKLLLRRILRPLCIARQITEDQFQLLLRTPMGPAWRDPEIIQAMKESLGECYDAYIGNVERMQHLSQELCKACKVQDPEFHKALDNNPPVLPINGNHRTPLDRQRFSRLNAQVKSMTTRASYAINRGNREELIVDLEHTIEVLESILSAYKEDHSTLQRPLFQQVPVAAQKAPEFWKHATNVYHILLQSWQCTCGPSLELQLKNYTAGSYRIELIMPFCHRLEHVRITADDFSASSKSNGLLGDTGDADAGNLNGPDRIPFTLRQTRWKGKDNVRSDKSSVKNTLEQSASLAVNPCTIDGDPLNLDLREDGLCLLFRLPRSKDLCLASTTENGAQYSVYAASNQESCRTRTSLAQSLSRNSLFQMTEAGRSKMAAIMVSSFLQFHATPWMTETWTAESIYLSIDSTSDSIVDMIPYVEDTIVPISDRRKAANDKVIFLSLGIILLELCFGSRFEDHPTMQNPAYSPLINDPFVRLAVAMEWSEMVATRAGMQYSGAIDWLLRQAPTSLLDGMWRETFERHVWRPIQRHFLYADPHASQLAWDN